MGIDFRADRVGLKKLLRSEQLGSEVTQLAQRIAANVRAEGQKVEHGEVELPVVVDEYTTDREAASVTLAHPAGLAVQAKHGTLTKAAAAVGLEVRER